MISEISEFSYGFALTNELVGWLELSAAPIFPSLIEEGKVGGGYDVKLDRPGAPLYLQFKRSECMTRRSAGEYKKVRKQGGRLTVPFYRFPITEATKSDQHELLLALDTPSNHVFYAAPRFHRLNEINNAWLATAVASRSVFVSPSEVGSLDDERHTVAFDASGSWVCSEPRPIRTLTSRAVLEKLQGTLREDVRPLRVRIPEFVVELRHAEQHARAQILERRRQADLEAEIVGRTLKYRARATVPKGSVPEGPRKLEAPEPNPPAVREPKPLEPELLALREASDMAARIFDAQLIIVQPAE